MTNRSSGRRPRTIDGAITLRPAREEDATALRRLAILDSQPHPPAGAIVAEHDGRLIAAMGRDGRQAIADPFLPTARVIEALRGWTAQAHLAA